MGARTRAIGSEHLSTETSTQELNESLRRAEHRKDLAAKIAENHYTCDDDVDVDVDGSEAEYVDGGYWVAARVWVSMEEVEDKLGAQPRPRSPSCTRLSSRRDRRP